MSKTQKIIYLVSTALVSLMMVGGALGFIFDYEGSVKEVTELGYPAYLVLFIAVAKIAGIAAIWIKKSGPLMQWAYAGLFFELLIVVYMYLNVRPLDSIGALIAIALLFTSYFAGKKHLA